MKKDIAILKTMSLLSILLMTFHLADDVARGMEPGGIKNILGVLILVVWSYGTIMLVERRSGSIIVLIGSLLGSAVPVLHMTGEGLVGGKIEGSSGVFFWVWTNLAIGVTSIFSVILAAQRTWVLQRKRSNRDKRLRTGP